MYRGAVYREEYIWRAWWKGGGGEGAVEISGGCIGKGQVSYVREVKKNSA